MCSLYCNFRTNDLHPISDRTQLELKHKMGLTTWYDKVILASPDTWIKSADLTRSLNTQRDLLTQTLRVLSSSLQQSTPPGRSDRPVEGACDLDSHASVPLSQLCDQGPITYSFSVSSVEKWKWTPNLLPIWHILKVFHKQKNNANITYSLLIH